MKEMPKYLCHKEVHALRIKGIICHPDGSMTLEFYEEGFGPSKPKHDYYKHHPKIGGYYVVYEDGYESWSPAEAFEKGYTLIQ